MEYALADTGLWYAMFDRTDQHHSEAKDKAEVLELFQIVLPWPTLYETLRTKFVRNSVALGQFERFLKRPNVTYLDDSAFRDAAFEMALEPSLRRGRPLDHLTTRPSSSAQRAYKSSTRRCAACILS